MKLTPKIQKAILEVIKARLESGIVSELEKTIREAKELFRD